MTATRWTDEAERRALLDGASALKLRAELLRGLSEDGDTAARGFEHHAEILCEMADCYAVSA